MCTVFSIILFGWCLESMVAAGHLLSTRLNEFFLASPNLCFLSQNGGNHMPGKRFNFGFSSLHLTYFPIRTQFGGILKGTL